LPCTLFRMAKAKEEPLKKKKRERKKRIVTTVSGEVISAKQLELAHKMSTSLEARDAVFEQDTQYPIDTLADYFANIQEGAKRILPKEKQRFVIYLRKSTDDEQKQVRSLDDQRDECIKLAREVLKIEVREEDIFEESASAKISGNREIFDYILQGFRTGKYHGLIAWSPDRISRNMKEAGEVIEMIDREYIQTLSFCTYQFENTPNGKMMLGILFATSKQYSDKLGVDVKRGTDGNIKDGKYNGVVKKGYYMDASTGYFIPDEYNWNLLRMAVDMRLNQGKSNPEIADFLNDAVFSTRKTQDDKYVLFKATKQKVADIFEDSFYCGLYQYGDNIVNLTDIYSFKPLITTDEYIMLNSDIAKDFNKKTSVKTNRVKRLNYGLLNNKVICDYCDEQMVFQHQPIPRGKNKGKMVVSFYCRDKGQGCLRHNKNEQKKQGIKLSKSIRAKHVMAGIEWQLRHLTKQSEEAYQMYYDRLESRIASRRAILERQLNQAKEDKRSNGKQYARLLDFQIADPKAYETHHKGRLEHYKHLVELAKEDIEKHDEALKELNTALPTKEEFYELTKSKLLDLLHEDDIVVLNAICNEFVTNLRAGNDTTPVIKLNPPYDLMVDLDKILIGRGERTRTSDLRVPNAAR
jgi:DNA invertase Pin-like site-specific DNA recombinase